MSTERAVRVFLTLELDISAYLEDVACDLRSSFPTCRYRNNLFQDPRHSFVYSNSLNSFVSLSLRGS